MAVHVTTCDLAELLGMWGSGEDVPRSLRKAKSLLVHSETITLEAVDIVAKHTIERSLALHPGSGSMLSRADIHLHEDEVLGQGQGGIVIRAECRSTKTPLAVKVVSVDNPSQRRQLFNSVSVFTEVWQDEALEGLMQLRSIFVEERKVFLAMDYMDLGGMRTLLDLQEKHCGQPRGIPEPVVLHILRQVLTGLELLHGRYVLHRDIKPENILVNSRGEARLADYGITTVLEEDDAGELVRSSSFVGTKGYLDPQLAAGAAVGFKADIWAVGCVLYEMATGEHPFVAIMNVVSPNASDGADRTAGALPPRRRSRGFGEIFGGLWEKLQELGGISLPSAGSPGDPQVSQEFRDMVARCLREKPGERPSAKELRCHRIFQSGVAGSPRRSSEAFRTWLSEVRSPAGH